MYLTMNMNRSIKSLQAFDEELECVICTGRLLNAKFLQCLHSFCAECLERCVTVRGNLEGTCRLRSISCPLCREETIVPDNGIDGLKPNNLANKVVQALEGNDHCAKVMDSELCCESCRAKRSRAVAYCQDCRHFICRDCVGSHSSMKQILSGHRIKPLTDLRRSLVKTRNGYKDANHGKTCYQHNGQTKTHFCETCSMLICVRCVGDTHTEPHHMCVEAKDAVKSRLRSIQELVEQGHDKQKEVAESLRTIDRQRNEAHRVIRRMQREINAAADAAAENALKSIDFQRLTLLKETDRLDEFLTGKYDELEAARLGVGSLLSNARSFGVKLMKNPSVNVLLTFDKLNTTLENLVSEQWDKASVDYIHNITQNVRFESQANTQWVSVGNLVDPNQWLLSRSIPISDVKDGEVSSMSYCSNGSLFLAHFNGVVDEMGIDGKLTHVLTTGSDIRDMAVLSDRTVVILDGTWQIAVYDPSGKKSFMIHPKNGSTGFTCLTADTNDMIFAGEFHRDTISVFGKDGSYVESIPAGGITPYRIVVTNSGKIVLSHSPASVSVLNRDGVVLCTIHRKQWQYALVCSDTKENIYILSGSRDEKKIISVHKYTLEGYIVECVVRHVEVDVGSWHPRIDCTPEGNLALVTKMKVDIYTTRSVIERERNETHQENSEEKEMQLENSNS